MHKIWWPYTSEAESSTFLISRSNLWGNQATKMSPPQWPANMGGGPKVKKAGGKGKSKNPYSFFHGRILIWFDKGKDKTPYYFFLMEKKDELERQGKLGNKSQDSLSREVFPIWNVSHTIINVTLTNLISGTQRRSKLDEALHWEVPGTYNMSFSQ